MGQYDDRLVAAITSGSHDDLKALEEPFARQIGQDPAAMEARKAATKAKYQRPLNLDDGDLRKSHEAEPEPVVDEKDALAFVQALEGLAAIRKKVRTGRKNRP